MNESLDGTSPRANFRLESGIDILESWAETACETQKNAVYQALFAMLDGALFRTYRVVDDFQRPSELFVIVRDDLVLKIRINCLDSFGVVDIGSPAASARLHRGRH